MNSIDIRLALRTAQGHGLTRIDTQALLLHALGRASHERAWLLAHDDDVLAAPVLAAFHACCQRLAQGEPLAYITGYKAFFGLDVQVDARVLDPRADTETLVDWALEVMVGLAQPRVLDLGTGSGAIALALAHQRPDARVHAVDASADALAVAAGNAQRLGLPVTFSLGNWLHAVASPLPSSLQRYDVIVSNPPYIASGDPHLAALAHEPLAALASGPDGLDDLRQITASAGPHLQPGGWLLLEHGYDQALAVQQLLQTEGFNDVQHRYDLAGIARCTGGRFGKTIATVK
jgi:release factor glutamine methyltransferase